MQALGRHGRAFVWWKLETIRCSNTLARAPAINAAGSGCHYRHPKPCTSRGSVSNIRLSSQLSVAAAAVPWSGNESGWRAPAGGALVADLCGVARSTSSGMLGLQQDVVFGDALEARTEPPVPAKERKPQLSMFCSTLCDRPGFILWDRAHTVVAGSHPAQRHYICTSGVQKILHYLNSIHV